MKITVVLTKSKMTASMSMSVDGVTWFDAGGFEGNLTVNGEDATLTATCVAKVMGK